MTENDIRELERYSKRELIGMLEAVANGLKQEEGRGTIYRLAFEQTIKASRNSDGAPSAADDVCPLMHAACPGDGPGCTCTMWDADLDRCRIVVALDALHDISEVGIATFNS